MGEGERRKEDEGKERSGQVESLGKEVDIGEMGSDSAHRMNLKWQT